ncbi:large subunit ribosomal protein L27Ae, partial [Phenoliferia sp. Uapishka_3]
MPTRFSKTRKHRGHVSAGHGRVGTGWICDLRVSTENIREDVDWLEDNTTTVPTSLVDTFLPFDNSIEMDALELEDGERNSRREGQGQGRADKYHYGYFGKVGMRHFNDHGKWRPVVNVDKLASLVPEEQRKELTAESTVVPVIDTLAAGFGKVLAKGRLGFPFIVKARYVSRRAEAKIVEAGGVVVITA